VLAWSGDNLFGDFLRPNIPYRYLIAFGRYCADGSEAEELLRGNGDTGASGAGDDLKKV
jgi:hypothetical protein